MGASASAQRKKPVLFDEKLDDSVTDFDGLYRPIAAVRNILSHSILNPLRIRLIAR